MTKTSEGMSLRAVIWGESYFQDLYKSTNLTQCWAMIPTTKLQYKIENGIENLPWSLKGEGMIYLIISKTAASCVTKIKTCTYALQRDWRRELSAFTTVFSDR